MHRANKIYKADNKYKWGLEILCIYGCDCVENTEWFDTEEEIDQAIHDFNFKIINQTKQQDNDY